jgi:predicted transcriptional regulator
MTDTNTSTDLNPVELAAKLTMAWLGNGNMRANADDVPAFRASMHKAVSELAGSNAGASNVESQAEAKLNMCPP